MKHKSIFSTLIIIFLLIGLVLVPSTSTAEEENQETTPIITAPLQPDTGRQVEIGTDIPIQEQEPQPKEVPKQETPSPQKEDPFEVKESGGTVKVPHIPQPSK